MHIRTNPGSKDRADVIYLGVHFIMSIRVGNVIEDFSTADETQSEARQFINQFLADEEGFQSLEAERKADVDKKQLGPRRIELLVQEKNPARLPVIQKRFVVTSLLEPTGNFGSYFLVGREWRSLEKQDLSWIKSNTNSETIDIIEMFIYDVESIYKKESEPFSTEISKQQTAWKRAWREFNRLSYEEKTELSRWNGVVEMSPIVSKPAATHYRDVDPEENDYGYSYSGWLGRTPTVYKPSPPHKAYFRVAGDSVGTALLRKHQERLLTAKPEIAVISDLVPETQTPDTKPSETKDTMKVSKPGLPIIFKPEPDFHECYCGMTGCDNCHLTSIMSETGGKRLSRYTIH